MMDSQKKARHLGPKTAGVRWKFRMLKRCTVWLIVTGLLCPSGFARKAPKADAGYDIIYDGGSVPSVTVGNVLRLHIDANQIRFAGCGSRMGVMHNKACRDGAEIAFVIPAAAITEISYGQDVHRRVGTAIAVAIVSLGIGALVALSKSKKHFVGLIWADGDKKGGLAMQCDKSNYRGIIAGLEGITGKKAVDSKTMNVKN